MCRRTGRRRKGSRRREAGFKNKRRKFKARPRPGLVAREQGGDVAPHFHQG